VDEEETVRNRNFLLLSLLVVFFFGCATENNYRIKRPFLYEAVKDDKKAYFFGTTHIGVDFDDLPDSFWPYFSAGNVFVSESAVSDYEVVDQKMKESLVRQEDGPYLSEFFSPAELKEISNYLNPYLKNRGVGLDDFSMFGIFSLLRLVVLSKEDNVKVEKGEYVRLKKARLDNQLIAKAISTPGKSIDVLDDPDPESLVKCYTTATLFWRDEIKDLLTKKVVNAAETASTLKDLEEYREGREDKVNTYAEKLPDCLIRQRHLLWMPKILSTIDKYEQPFFAVGLGHMIAKKGSLIEMLKQQGFKVRRMTETFLSEKK